MRPAGCSCLNRNWEIRKESWFWGVKGGYFITSGTLLSRFKPTQMVLTHVPLAFSGSSVTHFVTEVQLIYSVVLIAAV